MFARRRMQLWWAFWLDTVDAHAIIGFKLRDARFWYIHIAIAWYLIGTCVKCNNYVIILFGFHGILEAKMNVLNGLCAFEHKYLGWNLV